MPVAIRTNRIGQPAKSGQRSSTGAANKTCPLNMQPNPNTTPAVNHQSTETKSAGTKKNGSIHESHCGHPWLSYITVGSIHSSVAATNPHVGARNGAGKNLATQTADVILS